MDTDESKLILLSQQGDRNAFGQLIKRYERKVFGIAFGIVRNSEDAMDVSQDVFLRAFSSIKKFQGKSKFYTWIYRIAVNMSIDYINKRKRSPVFEHDDSRLVEGLECDWELLRSGASNPAKQLDIKELGERVSCCIAKLSESHRAVLILREIEGLSYQEISDVLECNRGTVMSRLFHARNNMKRMLQTYLDEEGD